MASNVVGLTVQLRLHSGLFLRGLVANVAHQNLYLTDVFVESTGDFFPQYVVRSIDIADVEVAPAAQRIPTAPAHPEATQPRSNSYNAPKPLAPARTASYPRPPPSLTPSSILPPTQLPLAQPAQPQTFADPAILSYTQSPEPSKPALQPASFLPAVKKTYAQVAEKSSPIASQLHARQSSVPLPVSATLTTPFAGLTNEPEHVLPKADERPAAKSGKRGKKDSRKPLSVHTNGATSPPSSPELSRAVNSPRKSRHKLQGSQEQAPKILAPPTASKRHRKRNRPSEQQSGWATEEATDIQELGDFDFEGNLSQFDKRTVFRQLRTEDTVAAEDRLVSFNRVSGMAKLRNNENVLDVTNSAQMLSSMSSSEEDAAEMVRDRSNASATRRMRRDLSKMSLQPVSRKNSAEVSAPPDPLGGTMRIHRGLARARYASSAVMSPPMSANSLECKSTPRPVLRYVESNRICPVSTPQGLLDVEDFAEESFYLAEDVIAEHAARSIVDIALAAISPGGSRLSQSNHNASPVIVILAASTKWGSRALAAARLLLDRGARVIISCLGFNADPAVGFEATSDPHFAAQLARLHAMDEDIYSWTATATYLKTLDAPPELIIDALLGPHTTLGTAPDPEGALTAMIAWANASKASVLALDVPSGIHGATGAVEVRAGEPAEVRARVVACLAAPSVGLLRACELRAADGEPAWRVFVCDVGVNRAWKALRDAKGGEAPGLGKPVRFGGEWVVEVRFDGGDGEAERGREGFLSR